MGRYKYLWVLATILLVSFCAAQEENESNGTTENNSIVPNIEAENNATNVPAAARRSLLFHRRSARFIIISDDRRVAYRRNNYAFGETAALTDRPLDPNEVFAVHIESFGHVENPRIGVTTHTPQTIPYPDYMNHLRNGTWGWDVWPGQIYQDGDIIKEPYPSYRPDIRHGDTFGVSVTPEGSLHFYHNGKDLGEAASGLVGGDYYAYVDLYWGGSNATIINYADNGGTTENNSNVPSIPTGGTTENISNVPSIPTGGTTENISNVPSIEAENNAINVPAIAPRTLLFHRRSARFIIISDDRRVAYRRNNYAFGEAAALTDRPLDPDEVFVVQIESFEKVENPRIGVTTHTPQRIPYPDYMNHLRRGTWGWDVWPGQIYQDGDIIKKPYPSNRPEIRHGDTFGVSVTSEGSLHFHHNGMDLGEAASGLIGGDYYAYVDLYWGGSNATIINQQSYSDALPLSKKN